MIPKDKYDIVNRWAAVKILAMIVPKGFVLNKPSPCTDLNDCKMVVDRLGLVQQCLWGDALKNLSVWDFDLLNAPADLRMEAVIKVFFPDKTIDEAIQEMERVTK